jgi:hypothetical protein
MIRGTIEVFAERNNGYEKKVDILENGDYFVEIALPAGVTRAAAVRAYTPLMATA